MRCGGSCSVTADTSLCGHGSPAICGEGRRPLRWQMEEKGLLAVFTVTSPLRSSLACPHAMVPVWDKGMGQLPMGYPTCVGQGNGADPVGTPNVWDTGVG